MYLLNDIIFISTRIKLMYWLNYFTETWYKTILLITILIILFLTINYLFKFIVEVFKQKLPIIYCAILIGLAYFSESEWCYLAVIAIIAYKGELIDNNMQKLIKEICNIFSKNPKDINSSISIEEKVSKEINMDFLEKYPNNYIQIENSKIDYKLKMLQSHKNVIDWFKREEGVLFEQEKELVYKDLKPIFLDGYYKTKCRDYILEIKRGYNNHNIYSIIENGISQLQKCEKYYDDSNKVVDFYLAVVFDKKLKIDFKKIKTFLKSKSHSKKYNYVISIFEEDENNNLTLVDGMVYLKTDVYIFKK